MNAQHTSFAAELLSGQAADWFRRVHSLAFEGWQRKRGEITLTERARSGVCRPRPRERI